MNKYQNKIHKMTLSALKHYKDTIYEWNYYKHKKGIKKLIKQYKNLGIKVIK